jgi:hypothetical protein
MGKKIIFLAILAVLVLAVSGVAHAWQGRMGGMGDPFGLIADESDYLIHPAKIANGEGVRFYGDYRFTYTGVTDWDYDVNVFNSGGTLVRFFRYNTSGYEQDHDVLLGSAFPLGPGRMGLFFSYQGKRSDYDGNVQPSFSPGTDTYDLVSKFDAFAMRLFYGLPVDGVPVVGKVKLGGEFQFAYRQEKNEADLLQQSVPPLGVSLENPQGSFSVALFSGNKNFLLFMLPYDSHYLETLFKGSIETTIGPVAAALTVRGGFIFNGDNEFVRIGTLNTFDLKGDVEGWRIGGDLWLRYPLAKDLTVPFLVRIDYQTKTRDGDGIIPPGGTLVGFQADYDSKERSFDLEVGGGLDKEFAKGLRLAAGIYYGYNDARNIFSLTVPADFDYADYSPYPSLIEHRLRVALAGEWVISPAVTLRMGLEPFYGWIHEDFGNASNEFLPFIEDVSLNGSRWGIGASVGGSVKLLQKLTLEPFVNGGYQEIKLDGDGTEFYRSAFLDVSELQRQWYIGGGFSILYDL